MTDALYIPRRTTWLATVREWQESWQERWTAASQTTRTGIQLGVLFGAVLIAYNYSLSTLFETLNQQTPLAYISLVPAFAIALAAVHSRPLKPEPPIYDRQVDYTIGIPLILAATAINELLPARLSAMFWFYRVDLFSLPIFVAGAVVILFGCRVLWRQKVAIAFLFLAWPYPYQKYLLGVLNFFTKSTLVAMEKIAVWTHLATPTGVSTSNPLFTIDHHGTAFALSIVSACSGVNSVVGFLLVGSVFAVIVKGPLVRKVLWLAGGMLLLYVLNIGRITFIFFAGRTWGETIAINVFHPFIGLVLFCVGVIVMLLMIRPLGMRIEIGPANDPGLLSGAGPVASSGSPVEAQTRKATLAVPKVYFAMAIVVVASVVIGISNVGLSTYNLVSGVAGQAKLTAYIQGPVAPPGWHSQYETSFEWAKPLFGDSSIWDRYVLHGAGGGTLHASVPVVADVINTPDLSSFSAFTTAIWSWRSTTRAPSTTAAPPRLACGSRFPSRFQKTMATRGAMFGISRPDDPVMAWRSKGPRRRAARSTPIPASCRAATAAFTLPSPIVGRQSRSSHSTRNGSGREALLESLRELRNDEQSRDINFHFNPKNEKHH